MAKNMRKQRVLAVISQWNGHFTLSEIAERVGDVPERTLRRWFTVWSEEGVVTKSGTGKSTAYCYRQFDSFSTTELRFLQPLDQDIRQSLLDQIRDLWTHSSTALEGNTLSLGDTHFILNEGLTISGKPIQDHQEVLGHAKAIDIIYGMLSEPLTQESLFELHRAVQTEVVNDIYKPLGDWKLEPNGTYAVNAQGEQHFIEYALPAYVPVLMDELISAMNAISREGVNFDNAHSVYAKFHMGFVHIHPFWDGNGRMARLVANIPLLKAGLPPLLIATDSRRQYIECLSQYQIAIGQLNHQTGVWPSLKKLEDFNSFCQSSYQSTKQLLENALEQQRKRSIQPS